jgi:hypothetical protein
VPPLLNLPGVVTIVCAVMSLFRIVDGAFGGTSALRKE